MRLANVYVGMTSEDFLDDGALFCRRNVTVNGLSDNFVVWCTQPVKGQYLTIRNYVYKEQDLTFPAGAREAFIRCFSLCEVSIYVKRK